MFVICGTRATVVIFFHTYSQIQSREPSGLRHEMSLLFRRKSSWVGISVIAWKFGVYMCLFCVCAVLCLGRGLTTRWSLDQGVLTIVNRSGNCKEARAYKGCRAIKKVQDSIPRSEPNILTVIFSDQQQQLRGFSPQANYTDRAIAAGQRS
jgi:hypothetical protein